MLAARVPSAKRFAVLDKDFLAAQAGLAIALQAGPQRISDQDEAIAAFHLISQFLRCRMDVEVVADQFAAGVLIEQCRPDDAGFTVMKGRHGII